MHSWQLQDAKARLSEVVRNATTEGPQSITVHGKPTVVVISYDEFERLAKPKSSFVEFMRQSPLMGMDLALTRNRSKTRDTDL
jgi:antitoxin Phd